MPVPSGASSTLETTAAPAPSAKRSAVSGSLKFSCGEIVSAPTTSTCFMAPDATMPYARPSP